MSYNIIGEQIAKFRKSKGLTQRELGEAIGVSASAVSQWESGGTPDISLLPALSDVLGVTVDSLFGREKSRREDMGEAAGKYLSSLPTEKRLSEFISLARKAMITGRKGGLYLAGRTCHSRLLGRDILYLRRHERIGRSWWAYRL